MQTINFITGEGYRIESFPDGENHLIIDELDRKSEVNVKCRIRSPEELFLLMQLKDILERQWVRINYLEIVYLMGMRMDRLMDINGSITLKIVSNVVNSLNAKNVYIRDVHSAKALELIKNSVETKTFDEVEGNTMCYPDNGAIIHYRVYGDRNILCSKQRTPNGGILIDVVDSGGFVGGDITVHDDLCDAGGTFIVVANEMRKLKPKNLNIQITHVITRKGLDVLAEFYDNVTITNSFHDWDKEADLPKNVKVISVI